MTVVATRTSSSPASNARITASFSSGGSLPCSTPIRRPASGPSASWGATSSTASGARRSSVRRLVETSSGSSGNSVSSLPVSPPTRGHTTYTWCPAATSSWMRFQTRSSHVGFSPAGTTVVAIGERPPGSSRSAETSRSPYTVIATVRGIGVAVMTSRCGAFSPRPRRASRCSTPKRCCSSTTTSPSSANPTRSWISACVPTTIPASPDCASSRAFFFAAAGSDPDSSVTPVACSAPPSSPACASGPSNDRSERACWAASTSVGREHRGLAAAVDDLQHRPQRHHRLARADIALHQPVHRGSEARSAAISAPTDRWPAVSV